MEHEQLVKLYEENNELRDKSKIRTLILAPFIIGIACAMKAVQETASLEMNIAATVCVTLLLLWHFKDFKHRRDLDKRRVNIVLDGIEIERRNSLLKLSFFQDYLKTFNVIGFMALAAAFDYGLLYFFSTSLTQLLNAINPEIVAKLVRSTPIRSFIVSACLGFAYYLPIRPLVHLKKELEGSWV